MMKQGYGHILNSFQRKQCIISIKKKPQFNYVGVGLRE